MADIKDHPVKTQLLYSQDSFEGGINFNAETAQSSEVADARNVWGSSSSGIESRPGKKPVGFNYRVSSTFTPQYVFYDASGGTYTAAANATTITFDAAVGDILYLKYTDNQKATGITSMNTTVTAGGTLNTAASRMRYEYWNGEAWVDLPAQCVWLRNTGTFKVNTTVYFYNATGSSTDSSDIIFNWSFNIPGDWAATSVNGSSGNWLRIRIVEAASTTTWSGRSVLHTTTIDTKNLYENQIIWPGGDRSFVTYGLTNTNLVSISISPTLSHEGEYYKSNIQSVNLSYRTSSDIYRPFDLTTLPEYGCAFFAADGIVFDIYKNSYTQAPADTTSAYTYAAQVEDDLNIIGDTKPLSKNFIPQESTYPHSKYVLWINSFLFHASQSDNPYIVRWSAPSSFAQKGYRVWPKISQTIVLGDDLSPITGLKAFGEHPLVLKRHSMWRMAYVGPGDDNLGIWEAVRVSGGVGTVSNNSVQITPVGMIHVYEDGVYVFDGVKSTKMSDSRLQEFWDSNVDLTKPEAFVSGHWRSKHCYLLSIPTKDRSGLVNNKVLVWDYQDNAWWIWDSLEVTSFFSDDHGSSQDHMYFTGNDGYAYELTGNTDNGTAISSYITTHRFGYKDNRTKQMRQVYVCSTPEAGSMSLATYTNDRDTAQSGSVLLSDPKEPAAGTLLWNQGTFSSTTKRRIRHLNFRERGKWFQVKASHSTNNKPFKLTQIQVAVALPVEKVR